MHGFALIEIGVGVLLVSILLKYKLILRNLVFVEKSKHNEVGGLSNDRTYLHDYKHSIHQQPSKCRCSENKPSRLRNLFKQHARPLSCSVKGFEWQATILVCDADDEGQIDSISSLNHRATVSKWRKKVYYAFDSLCVEYGVIKMQTSGNAFVAISGMQGKEDPNQAIKMAYFADACQKKLHCLLPLMKLDSTSKILASMRFGIHTGTYSGLCKELGQISADHQPNFRKLLDRARIMQKTSLPGQIHLSKSTAKHFKSSGMEAFVDRRTDGRLVVATYWLTLQCGEDIQPDNTNAEAAFDSCIDVV